MKIIGQYNSCNYKYSMQKSYTPVFGFKLKPQLLFDVFTKSYLPASNKISGIKNIHPGEYGTECSGSIPLKNFEEVFTGTELSKFYKTGISTNTGGWANSFLKSSADNPLSTSSVYDCSVLYLFNKETNTHFMYHSYYNVKRDFFNYLIRTFMPEGISDAAIIPGDSRWFKYHKNTLQEMFASIKNSNKSTHINVYHNNSSLPEIVGYKGTLYEIPNQRAAMGLSDKGQASFKICDLQISTILDDIEYNAVTTKRISAQRELFISEKYDIEVLKILNNILDERQQHISKIEACRTLEELENTKKSFNSSELLKYFNAFEHQKRKMLSATL